ncbi:MAG: aspartate aminotransferase family protein [Deltaproteobacteria bacterium]|nr:aspartate aminotransferase family protein [Deltaproteobacteria bacterium]
MSDNPTDDKPVERTEGDVNLSDERRQWQDAHLDDATRALLDEDARYFLHQSLSTPCLNALSGAEGAELIDTQGRRYLDFHGNSAHQVGYGHPAVIEAVIEQLRTLPFSPRRYTNRVAVDLARKLAELSPGRLNKVLFAPGGTSAIGMALKLARVATGRFKTVSWWDSFHGASLDAISIGGEALFRRGVGPLLPGAIHVPPPSSYRSSVTGNAPSPMESAEYVDYVMRHEGDVAAFIAEPIRCTTVEAPPVEYWRRIREICDEHGALLIFDEIPIGLGRTGYMFACERFGVTPDILCLGKGLGGGVFPMAAMLAREDLDVAGHAALGHFTHEKSPVGAAAALATIHVIEREGLLARSMELGDRLTTGLREISNDISLIGDVRAFGALVGVELVTDRTTKDPASAAAEKVLYECLSRGLSFKVSGGNVLTLAPPLTLTGEELERSLGILRAALEAAAEQ